MGEYTREELAEALQIVSSSINNCEKAHPKFAEGTSQHTLLKNRIKALYISRSFILDEDIIAKYTKEELIDALRPVSSIIGKCEKGKLKFAQGTSHHTRFMKIIKAMDISKSLITNEIGKRG
jgi:DNA-binding XRE family transcriptional regulator